VVVWSCSGVVQHRGRGGERESREIQSRERREGGMRVLLTDDY